METQNGFAIIEKVHFLLKDTDFYIQRHLGDNNIGYALGNIFNTAENYLVLGMLSCTIENDIAKAAKHFQRGSGYYLQYLTLLAENPSYYRYITLNEIETGLFLSILADDEIAFSHSVEILNHPIAAKNTERFWVQMCGALQAALIGDEKGFKQCEVNIAKVRKRTTEKYYMVYIQLYYAYLKEDGNLLNEALEACSNSFERRKTDSKFVEYSGIDGDPESDCTPYIFDYRATAMAKLSMKKGMQVSYFSRNIPRIVPL